MRHVAAYLLASMGSGQPTAANIKAILGSVGVEADEKQLEILINKLSGKNLNQLLAAGKFLRFFCGILIPCKLWENIWICCDIMRTC